MRILVTNDDGIHAKGLYYLVEKLNKIAKVYVLAPDRERSATGHAITIHDPIRTVEYKGFSEGVIAYHVDGTPADCVKLGVSTIMEEKPDIVISGINAGPNLGTDVLYSGTVAGAVEAAILNIPGIAFSLAGYDDFNYEEAAEIAVKTVESIFKHEFDRDSIFNVNIPSIPKKDCKGIAITKLGIRKYKNFYEQRSDPRGKQYYWLAGDLMEFTNTPETDVTAIENGYISITPLHLDLTNYRKITEMKGWDL